MLGKNSVLPVLLSMALSWSSHLVAAEKVAELDAVTTIAIKLFEVAKQRQRSSDMSRNDQSGMQESPVVALLKDEKNNDVLVRVALISWVYMHPGRPEDHVVDSVFEESWRTCVKTIEKNGGLSAIDALENIKRNMPLDGAFSLQVRDSLQRLKRTPKR